MEDKVVPELFKDTAVTNIDNKTDEKEFAEISKGKLLSEISLFIPGAKKNN